MLISLPGQKVHYSVSSLFCCCCWLSLGLDVWQRLGDPFVSQNHREVCASHFIEQILGCALFWIIVHIVKFKLLEQFPVNHLTHSVVSIPILLLLFTLLEFFTSVFADGFSLEFEWQQVSSSLQDSSQDSGRSKQCCRLDSLYPSANFQVL